ncbi:helix-turn-helix domain-containing protein [Clostridium perfringens]|uniref:helix-turn-helix domain-containing protein n=1 Tax=Clostridium perfringens TaxID=1502 RepID=UPI0022484D54|nr:helix-turn-helix transcriptional regulator [Clostridium perfringens]MCX0360745.1 helix-turn-helix domain-containing protein [Clostridium perfringens]
MNLGVGEKIRFLRMAKRVTQKELADYLDCNARTVSLHEKNKHLISFETLKKIAEFFEVSLDYFDVNEEIYEVPRVTIHNTRATEEFSKTVVGILEATSKIVLNDRKILGIDLGTHRDNEIKNLLKWDYTKTINILDTELDVLVKENIEIITFKSIQKVYKKNMLDFKIEKLLSHIFKVDKNYGLVLGFNEGITDFTETLGQINYFKEMVLNQYLSLSDKIIIPLMDSYTLKQGKYAIEKISNMKYIKGEVIILKYECKSLPKKAENLRNLGKIKKMSNFKTAKINNITLLEELKASTCIKMEINKFISNSIENNVKIQGRCLKNIVPIWGYIPENVDYFSCNTFNTLKKLYLDIIIEININFNIIN